MTSPAIKFPFSRDERVKIVRMALSMSPRAFMDNYVAEHDAEKYPASEALRWIAAQINDVANDAHVLDNATDALNPQLDKA